MDLLYHSVVLFYTVLGLIVKCLMMHLKSENRLKDFVSVVTRGGAAACTWIIIKIMNLQIRNEDGHHDHAYYIAGNDDKTVICFQ